jgi:dihydroxyacid dehydratase/phosphogluconate dehydratase
MAFNRRSKNITQGIARSPNRSMYYALGYKEEDFDKPMIGIANGHSTITPCNSGLQKLADAAVESIRKSDAKSTDLRHADDLGRHVDGHRRHEVLARVARSDRRLY